MKTMRQSRQSSVLSVSDKNRYPRCERKKQHQKQSLNLICLSPHCKNRGLICVMCKSQHTGHNIQPVKTFLTKLEESLKKIQLNRAPKIQQNPSMISEPNKQNLFQRLQEQHLEMLSLLKIQIEEISQKVRICQQEVMKEYNRLRQKIETQFQKQKIIDHTLSEIHKYFNQFQERQQTIDLKLNLNKLLPLLKIDKNDIRVINQADKDINSYVLSTKTFKNNMLVWQRQTSNIITDIFKNKPDYQIKQTQQRPTTAIDPSSKTASLTFASQLKTQSVVLDKQGKNARVKDDKNGKMVLLNPSVLEYKNNTVKFKITALAAGSSIAVGLCMKNQMTQKQFKFEKLNPNHGIYAVATNGTLYSSNDQAVNNSKCPLTYKTADQLTVEVDAKENKLIIKKKNDEKTAEINLKHLKEIDWKQLHFCIGFSKVGDKVQLIG